MTRGGVRRVPVQMDKELRATPVRGEDHRVRLEAGYRQMPVDANCYIHVDRMVGPRADGGEELLGHLIEMDVLNAVGTHIELKLYRGDALAIVVDGLEVFKWQKLQGGSSCERKPVRKRTASVAKKATRRKPISKEEDDDFEFE